nr:MAG TPA: hypothetical protein [Caudoviricetes sp.]
MSILQNRPICYFKSCTIWSFLYYHIKTTG